MTGPVLVPLDPEEYVITRLLEIMSRLPECDGWRLGNRLPDRDPLRHNIVVVRHRGSRRLREVRTIASVEVRVRTDGTKATQLERQRVARLLASRMRRPPLRASALSGPVEIPDETDTTKWLAVFDCEIPIRDHQEAQQ